MKKLIMIFAVVLSLGLLHNPVKASHLAAMDLTLTCLGGNDYLVKFVFYRDCSGVSAPSTVALAFQCSSNPAYNFTINSIPLLAGSGQEVTQNCLAMPTRCTGGTLYGVREHVFQVQVTLPPCNSWKVYWPGTGSFCCRNPSNTIASSSSQGGYIEATLNNLNAPCNSSPVFTNKPVTMMCVGQTQCYNHGAFDPDGDSLVYSMVTPSKSIGPTYVSWIPPYTATQPLPSNPPITLDPVTGDICMTPTMNIISPMAVKVEQWRTINGVPTLIGTIYRDLQVNVVACNNQIPKLSGMDTTMVKGYDPNDTIYSMEVCLGDTVRFTMWGYDADGPPVGVLGDPHKFAITWNNGIPQGTFTAYYNNTDSARATFIWKPNASHVSTVPKCFTATIKDGACPFNGAQTFAYCVTVRGMSVNIGADTLLCKGESVTFNAVADTTTVNYIWYLDGIPTGVPLSSTSYTLNTTSLAPGIHIVSIQTNDGGTTVKCPGVDQAIVNVVPLPKPNLGNDTLLCEPNTINLDAGPGAQYIWSTGAGTQTITVTQTGTYTVVVDGGNGTRCTGTDQVFIEIVPIPVFALDPDTCVKDPFSLETVPYLPGAHYNWSSTNGLTSTTTGIQTAKSGIYHVTVTYKPGSGCEASASRKVSVVDFAFQPADTFICSHDFLNLTAPQTASGAGYNYHYDWKLGGSTIQSGSEHTFVVVDKDPDEYIYTVFIDQYCEASIKVQVEHCETPIPNVITPNGDGINETFKINNLEFYPGSKLVVYNRHGMKVYESIDYPREKGEWNAEGNPDGVYYFVLYRKNRVVKPGGKEFEEYKGTITVLRSR